MTPEDQAKFRQTADNIEREGGRYYEQGTWYGMACCIGGHLERIYPLEDSARLALGVGWGYPINIFCSIREIAVRWPEPYRTHYLNAHSHADRAFAAATILRDMAAGMEPGDRKVMPVRGKPHIEVRVHVEELAKPKTASCGEVAAPAGEER